MFGLALFSDVSSFISPSCASRLRVHWHSSERTVFESPLRLVCGWANSEPRHVLTIHRERDVPPDCILKASFYWLLGN